jgi:hypothetical protein
LRTVTFISVTEKQQKINFYGGATTNYKKKNIKVRGLHITYKTVKFYNMVGTEPSLGFCVWSVNKLDNYCKKKTSLDINVKGNYGRKVIYIILPSEDSRTS